MIREVVLLGPLFAGCLPPRIFDDSASVLHLEDQGEGLALLLQLLQMIHLCLSLLVHYQCVDCRSFYRMSMF